MGKIEEARRFLQTIGMPKAQQADICCYVLLAMAGIKPKMSWDEAFMILFSSPIPIMKLLTRKTAGKLSENKHYIDLGQLH